VLKTINGVELHVNIETNYEKLYLYYKICNIYKYYIKNVLYIILQKNINMTLNLLFKQ